MSSSCLPLRGEGSDTASQIDHPEEALSPIPCTIASVNWQSELVETLSGRLPGSGQLVVIGSATSPELLDGWSDLDVRVDLRDVSEPADLLAGLDVWAFSQTRSDRQQVVRVVLRDGRRLDLLVEGGTTVVPTAAVDNEVRFVAALAAAKLGRGDHLIGLHLTLDLIRTCLVQAMELRDRELGTTVHRYGSERDEIADGLLKLLQGPVGVTPRPNIVERTVLAYAQIRRELDASYVPDWSGLDALLSGGLSLRGDGRSGVA